MRKIQFQGIIFGVFFSLMLLHSQVFCGEAIQITHAYFSDGTLILNGTNFDTFGQPNISIGDTLLSSCEVGTSQITCDISGTPASDGGTWRIVVSTGKSPHTNTSIDAFNQVVVPEGCFSGDFNDCYQGEISTKDVGNCQTGTRVCLSNGMWDSECLGQVLPVEENILDLCGNSLDDDCDGFTDDEDPDCCGYLIEVCDGVDNNCNGEIDEGLSISNYFLDSDGDGFGNPYVMISGCQAPIGYVNNDLDCFDNNPNAKPGQDGSFGSHRGDGSFDYNCDGNQAKYYDNLANCSYTSGCSSPYGYINEIPACGTSGDWLISCSLSIGTCSQNTVTQLQLCN